MGVEVDVGVLVVKVVRFVVEVVVGTGHKASSLSLSLKIMRYKSIKFNFAVEILSDVCQLKTTFRHIRMAAIHYKNFPAERYLVRSLVGKEIRYTVRCQLI